MSCLFCRIATGEIPVSKVYEDTDMLVFNDINPQAPLHVQIIPKRHIATTERPCRNPSTALVGQLVRRAAAIAGERVYADRGYWTVFNCNAEAESRRVSTSTCTCWQEGTWAGRRDREIADCRLQIRGLRGLGRLAPLGVALVLLASCGADDRPNRGHRSPRLGGVSRGVPISGRWQSTGADSIAVATGRFGARRFGADQDG